MSISFIQVRYYFYLFYTIYKNHRKGNLKHASLIKCDIYFNKAELYYNYICKKFYTWYG